MAAFRFERFLGLRPRISKKKLAIGEATTAENLKLGSGDLEPIPEKVTEQAVGSGRQSRTIYKFDNDGAPLWFEWDDYVDVARGPVKDDSLERTYYTGDTLGNGAPKMTTIDLADAGGGGPYPENWLYIGVPAPADAPSVTPTALPEDKPAGLRLAEDFFSDEFLIDEVKWTVYPGTGTRNQTWRLNSAAAGAIAFDVQPGTSFRVSEIINNNKVKIESSTEPGITMRTLNSDKSSVNDWHPMDEQGTTQEADWVGWRIPDGMEIKIISHNLNVGDVIVVSAVNYTPQFFSSLTTDFTEVDWPIEATISDGASTFYQILDARVSGESFSGDGAWSINGSFYYDVDRASSDTSELEDRSYVYTYVNEFGEEGPPSPPSVVTPLLDGQSVLVEGLSIPPTIGYNIATIRMYRTNSTEAGTEYQFVGEFDARRTFRDDIPSAELGEIISTTTWDPPDPEMKGIIALPNGVLCGFNGKNIYFCEPYFPHAWPPEYDQAVNYDIVGLAAFGNSVAILTKGWPSIATGSHPRNMNIRPIKVNQACLSKEGIASDGDKVYYPSPDGLIEISVNGISIKTEQWLDPKDWKTYSPSAMVSEFYEGRYYGFYDFDVSAVDPVITAEVSGTITDADEADLINGGRSVVLELQNEQWIAEGASFNATRQAIIDGLTAATSQTLGWNNVIRDTELSVTDVVRLTDAIVQITLPVATGYAITTSEVIQPLIPLAALVTSTSDLPTGSTFTIQPQQFSATVTIGGSIDGAAEADIVTGTETVTLTLTKDIWESGTVFDAYRQEIIDGLSATTDEQNGWNDRVPQLIAVTDVVRTSDTIVTITLPAVPLYSVTANESIISTVPHEALVTQLDVDVVSSNSVAIIALGVITALFGDDIIASVTENEIIAGGKILTITLTNDTWIAAGTGPIGTIAQTDSIIDALLALTSPTLGWNNVVVPGVETTDLVRTSPTVATITFDAESTYSIASNETIGATIPADVLTTSTIDVDVSNTFGITSQAPVTASLSGTITATSTELDIVDGGKTIILTLSDDTWVTAGATFEAQRQNIIDGLTASTSPTNGWNNEVRDGTPLDVGDVVRTSDTIVTITLPAVPLYDVAATETITVTIPATALSISAGAVVASPTFTVDDDLPASIAQTGTADASDSDDIITGGGTIILTVTNDTWVASGTPFNNQRQNIIDGLDAATSPANGWNNEIRDIIGVGQVVRTSATVVTITIPATANYDVNAAEVITVTVPASALEENSIAVVSVPDVDISAVSTATSRLHIAEDNGDGNDAQLHTSFWNPEHWYDYAPAIDDSNKFIWSMVFVPGLGSGAGRIVVGAEKLSTDSYLYTSDDDGATWTERTSAIALSTGNDPRKMWYVDSVDGDIIFNLVETFKIQYSSDGITWTEITTAFKAGTPAGSTAFNFVYGGDYIYARTSKEVIPSADLSGVNDVEDNWGSPITPGIGSTQQPIGSGNGKVLSFYIYSGLIELQWIPHGNTAYSVNTLGTKKLPSSSGLGISFVVFGDNKWLLLEESSRGWKVDIDGEAATYDEDPENYTRISSALVESGSMAVSRCWYDTELGFVIVGNVGSGAAEQVKVYTSPDLTTWTLRQAFAAESTHLTATRNPADSQARINGTALD